MRTIPYLASGLQAAVRLARGQPEALELLQADAATTANSFWAIGFCLPFVVCRVLMNWVGSSVPTHPGHEMGREIVVFILGWLLFVEVTHASAKPLGRSVQWPRGIALWNWCNVVEGVLVILGAVPGLLGAPEIVDEACQLITIGWALWLEWFALRLGLGIGGGLALAFTAMDQVIGIVLGSVALMLAH